MFAAWFLQFALFHPKANKRPLLYMETTTLQGWQTRLLAKLADKSCEDTIWIYSKENDAKLWLYQHLTNDRVYGPLFPWEPEATYCGLRVHIYSFHEQSQINTHFNDIMVKHCSMCRNVIFTSFIPNQSQQLDIINADAPSVILRDWQAQLLSKLTGKVEPKIIWAHGRKNDGKTWFCNYLAREYNAAWFGKDAHSQFVRSQYSGEHIVVFDINTPDQLAKILESLAWLEGKGTVHIVCLAPFIITPNYISADRLDIIDLTKQTPPSDVATLRREFASTLETINHMRGLLDELECALYRKDNNTSYLTDLTANLAKLMGDQ